MIEVYPNDMRCDNCGSNMDYDPCHCIWTCEKCGKIKTKYGSSGDEWVDDLLERSKSYPDFTEQWHGAGYKEGYKAGWDAATEHIQDFLTRMSKK